MPHFVRKVGPSVPYSGKKIAVSTMHLKDTVIARSLRKNLNARYVVPIGINTDSLGTFTGEVERSRRVVETAIAKARMGMEKIGLPYGLASEGSYGPHPEKPHTNIGIEVMVLVDDIRDIVICETLTDPSPKYHTCVVEPSSDIEGFLKQAGFPDHAMIVRPNCWDKTCESLTKGITDIAELERTIRLAASLSVDGKAFLQNDMRAHMNPTRMAAIGQLADQLCVRVKSTCPECDMPGFGTEDSQIDVPCEMCGLSISDVSDKTDGCVSCGYRASDFPANPVLGAQAQTCASCTS
jgi:hypothetical protein